MDSTVQERVQKGINWLDQVRPSWRERIAPEVLVMEDGEHCICGHVFGDEAPEGCTGFTYATRLAGCDSEIAAAKWAESRGFLCMERDISYEMLRVEWLLRLRGDLVRRSDAALLAVAA
jgi:hypothetical protein